MADAATWATLNRYASTGSTQAFLDANPGMSTATLEQAQREYPQVTMFGRAAARRRAAGGAGAGGAAPATSTGAGVQRGGATGPLTTAAPTPLSDDEIAARRARGTPEPDRLKAPQDETFAKSFTRQLKALDNKAAVIPTPGDLGPWILALIVLLFAIVPFNGYTRLQLIWLSLTGAAHVPDFYDMLGDWVRHVAGTSSNSGNGGSSGGSVVGVGGALGGALGGLRGLGGGAIAQGNKPGSTPPPSPKQEAPGGFTPRSVPGGAL